MSLLSHQWPLLSWTQGWRHMQWKASFWPNISSPFQSPTSNWPLGRAIRAATAPPHWGCLHWILTLSTFSLDRSPWHKTEDLHLGWLNVEVNSFKAICVELWCFRRSNEKWRRTTQEAPNESQSNVASLDLLMTPYPHVIDSWDTPVFKVDLELEGSLATYHLL